MALTKRPARPANIDEFINAAPDAVPAAAPAAKPQSKAVEPAPSAGGRKKLMSVTMQPHLIAQLDEVAQRMGLSRAAAISLAVSRLVASENRGAE